MYPITSIFRTIQGEGILSGIPMVFVRLAGCNVNCPQCDTDYRKTSEGTADDILTEIRKYNCKWVWITGGEPTIHNLVPLFDRLNRAGYKVALVTSGEKDVPYGVARIRSGPNFISVSPHKIGCHTCIGDQLNLVDGLNGIHLSDWLDIRESFECSYQYKYVTPLFGDTQSLERCIDWVNTYSEWRLNIQAHKYWMIP